jgi:riboflavin kinase / FMN adenylyltransferase
MEILHQLEDLEGPCRDGVCMTIGVFDAVHLGHQALIRRSREESVKRDLKSLVFTFERHPLALLAPVHCPPTLTQPRARAGLIEGLGVDLLLLLRFTRDVASIPPEEFVERVLVGLCRVRFLICGRDFSFGAGGRGNVQLLRELSTTYGYDLEVLPPVMEGRVAISSTRVRDTLLSGDVDRVVPMLSRRYAFTAEVVTGDQRGRQIGFPTANLIPEAGQLIPADGVYAVFVTFDHRRHGGMLNIGSRPTFEGAGRSIEVHLFDFSGDLVGRDVELEFVRRLRDERKFSSVNELVAQLKNDESASREILAGE